MFWVMMPGSALLIDASLDWMGSPVGQTDRNDFVGRVEVDRDVHGHRGRAGRDAADTGDRPRQGWSWPSALPPAGTPMGPPSVPRVSSTRTGGMPTKSEGAAGRHRLSGDEVLAVAAACADGEGAQRHCSGEQQRSTDSRWLLDEVVSSRSVSWYDKGHSLVLGVWVWARLRCVTARPPRTRRTWAAVIYPACCPANRPPVRTHRAPVCAIEPPVVAGERRGWGMVEEKSLPAAFDKESFERYVLKHHFRDRGAQPMHPHQASWLVTHRMGELQQGAAEHRLARSGAGGTRVRPGCVAGPAGGSSVWGSSWPSVARRPGRRPQRHRAHREPPLEGRRAAGAPRGSRASPDLALSPTRGRCGHWPIRCGGPCWRRSPGRAR